MIRVHIFCEGQTEETFVKSVLQKYLCNQNIFANPILLRTSSAGKGGVVTYEKIKRQIEIKCKEDSDSYITTMIDFYGLPKDFPNKRDIEAVPDNYKKITAFEKAFNDDINQKNFVANLLLHEYEALLLVDLDKFETWFDKKSILELRKDIIGFDNPEEINNNPRTAPSKRILQHCREYNKILHGSLIIEDIGLENIRAKCKHFNNWIENIECLSKAKNY